MSYVEWAKQKASVVKGFILNAPEGSDSKSLHYVQSYVKYFSEKQGWDNQNPYKDVGLLCEEAGELAQAVRRVVDGRDSHDKEENMNEQEKIDAVKEEIGDVLRELANIANRYGITLDEAFKYHREKLQREYGE
ncbi:MazG nucleotide pyrophosphohydrolase domain protein [compost metagenome]